MYKALLNTITLVLGSSVLASSLVLADQPSAVFWKYDTHPAKGNFQEGITPGGDDQVYVDLFSNRDFFFEKQVLIVFQKCDSDPAVAGKPVLNLDEIIENPKAKPIYADFKDPGARWKICTEKNVALFNVEDNLQLELQVDFLRSVNEGMSPRLSGKIYEISEHILKKTSDPEELAKLMAKEQPAANLTIDLYYRLDTKHNIWIRGDYSHVFGSASEGPKMTNDYKKVESFLPVDLHSYRSKVPLPYLDAKPSLKLPMEDIYSAGSGKLDQHKFSKLNSYLVNDFKFSSFAPNKIMAKSGNSHTLTGKFSTKWSTDHNLHSGFGFRVEAWTNESGSWQKLASDWVQSNGYWNLNVANSKNYQGNHLRVLYRSYNRYYKPQNENGDTYSWRDPDQYNISSHFDSGHRFADTDGGQFNGVGELVDAAMYMWSRLYWNGSIDPVPSNALPMYYPNTWYDCGLASGNPWSCANAAGEIWLIATHGTQADVVVHEMAHQLNNKFWNNKRPAGSGGSHTLSGCYPAKLGMALREGFADFLPAWVGYPHRNVADGGFGSGRWALDLDAEQRTGSPNCTNGWENEVWVARNFWDLHDTHADGDDILWFNHKGAVISLYLGNGVANNGDAMDMRDFENIYRDAASSGHENFITDIFQQNRM